jgi:hypothetical protein
MGNKGAIALAEALQFNTTLENISLSENKVGNGGAAALAKALEVNKTLKKMDLMKKNWA